uniref:Uncharacterized protein n=1 Tax=Schizaphis graminum TaxID=13262 RepID=A0A2S2NHI9_SCHGA
METIIRIILLIIVASHCARAFSHYEALNKFIQRDKDRRAGRLCPPMVYMERYEVAFVDNGPTMYGCAYIQHDRSLSDTPLFHLWLERHDQPSIEPAYCKNMSNMNHYIFECLTKDDSHDKEEFEKGFQYMSLYEYTANASDKNISKTDKQAYRCAVFAADDYVNYGVVVIRMALSKGIAHHYDAALCDGLSNLLSDSDLKYDPPSQQNWPKGSQYVFVMGELQPKRRITTTTTTTTTPKPPLNFFDYLAMVLPHRPRI